MGNRDHLLQRRDGAQHIRHMRDGDNLGARRQRPFKLLNREISLVIHAHPFQHRALALAVEMPGHDVGMVLHDGKHNLVTRANVEPPERVGHEVDGFRRRARKNNLVG